MLISFDEVILDREVILLKKVLSTLSSGHHHGQWRRLRSTPDDPAYVNLCTYIICHLGFHEGKSPTQIPQSHLAGDRHDLLPLIPQGRNMWGLRDMARSI